MSGLLNHRSNRNRHTGMHNRAMRASASLAAFAVTLTAQATYAEDKKPDPKKVTALETIVVTATRSPNESFKIPASVTVVNGKLIQNRQAETLSTLLKDVPNVNYGGGPRAASQMPTIRGLQGPRVILSVDGARRNFEGGVHTPLLLDPDMVRQVDVVRGPMSASYGGGGLGGVMAFETITADDFLQDGKNVGGRIKAGYRSGNEEFSTNLTAAARSGDFDLLASGTFRKHGDIHTGESAPDATYPNDGNLKNGLVKSTYTPNDLNKFQFSYQRFYDRHIGPNNPGGNTLFPYNQELTRQQNEVVGSWSFNDEEKSWLDGKLTLYHTRFQLDGETRSVPAQPNTSQVTATTGASLQNSSTFETGDWLEHRLTYGIDTYRDSYENRSNSAPNSVTPDGSTLTIGGFLQDEMTVSDDWTVIAALRHDTYQMSSTGQADTTHSHLSPKLTVKYQPWEAFGVYASYGQAYRAPTVTEMYGNLNTTQALFNFRPNPDLRPETSTTFEAGAMFALDGILADGDKLRAKASYFNEEVEDLIDQQTVGTYVRTAPFVGTGLIFQRRNVALAKRHGAELEGTYAWDDVTLGLGYSTVRSKDRATGNNLYSPPDKFALSAQYAINENWSVRYLGQFVEAQDYDSTTLRRRGGYATHDVGVTYEKNQFRADFGITNLFDKGYATYQQTQANTYTYEEGRSFNLTLSAKF